ncbi:MAG: aminotransferase class V-fold PLP-dependent enzyme [Saprospiraceae bacterium]
MHNDIAPLLIEPLDITDLTPVSSALPYSPDSDDAFFERLRETEFARLDREGHVYLDYTGGNLYPLRLLEAHFAYLRDGVYGNPHSINPTSAASTRAVEAAREAVVRFFHAEDYYCIFTANASASLHIIGECYPFGKNTCYLLSADNHNSVNGIREYCRNKGGEFRYFPLNYDDLTLHIPSLAHYLDAYEHCEHKLLAYPAQSNVSGVKHSLDWIAIAQSKGWDVLLDAAAYVPTSRLDLRKVKPDFTTVSFYKIFGYPTGLGCLLVRKDKFDKLRKPWFAGGTVSVVSVQYAGHFLMDNHERFEEGTVNYLDIPAITNGLRFMDEIGMERLSARVIDLCGRLKRRLEALRHSNGLPVVRLFGPARMEQRGGVLLMNLQDAQGRVIPFETVEEEANECLISVRTGCFCNPGVDEINNCLSAQDLAQYFAHRESGNFQDMLEYLGKMRGAVRISLGMATINKDLDRFVEFVASHAQ